MTTNFIEQGNGRPLVFLHGIGGNAQTWQHQMAAFAGAYRVIALDLPGYGRSSPLPQTTFPALAGWLHEFLEAQGLQRPILVGHSFGGMIAQEYLALFPGQAGAVVLYATSPAFGRRDGEWQQKFIRARLQPLDEGKRMAELAPGIAKRLVGSGADAAGIELAQQGIAAVPEETFRTAVLCLVEFDRRQNLGRINIPCLVIAGAEDGNAPADMMERMAARIPTARFVCLPRLGHLPHLENPGQFNATLRAFLQTAHS